MKHLYTIVISAVLLLSLCSCNGNGEDLKWGETSYYNDSFLKKYEPVIMSRTLNFSINEDGYDLRDTEFMFQLYEGTPNGGKQKATDIIIYKNGKPCQDNILRAKGGEGNVVVGIEFTDNAVEGYHTLYLKEISLNGLDRIDYQSLGDGFVVQKRDVANPANVLATWIVIALVSLYLAWVIILRRLLCPHLEFSQLDVYYPNNVEEITLKTRGYCNVIFTNKPIKQSFLRKIFFVENLIVVNELWTSQVKIKPGKKQNVRVYTRMDIDASPNDIPQRKDKFYIINDDNQRIGIETY